MKNSSTTLVEKKKEKNASQVMQTFKWCASKQRIKKGNSLKSLLPSHLQKERKTLLSRIPWVTKTQQFLPSLSKYILRDSSFRCLSMCLASFCLIVPLTSVRLLTSIMLQMCLNIYKTEAKYRASICFKSAIRKS